MHTFSIQIIWQDYDFDCNSFLSLLNFNFNLKYVYFDPLIFFQLRFPAIYGGLVFKMYIFGLIKHYLFALNVSRVSHPILKSGKVTDAKEHLYAIFAVQFC